MSVPTGVHSTERHRLCWSRPAVTRNKHKCSKVQNLCTLQHMFSEQLYEGIYAIYEEMGLPTYLWIVRDYTDRCVKIHNWNFILVHKNVWIFVTVIISSWNFSQFSSCWQKLANFTCHHCHYEEINSTVVNADYNTDRSRNGKCRWRWRSVVAVP